MPLAQLRDPTPTPSTDQRPTLCLACGSEVRDCACSAARLAEAAGVVSTAHDAGRDPVEALDAWRAVQ